MCATVLLFIVISVERIYYMYVLGLGYFYKVYS